MSLADPTAPWYAHATQQRLLDHAAGLISDAENRRLKAEIAAAVWADTPAVAVSQERREASSAPILVSGAA